jgi:hypothetical protein
MEAKSEVKPVVAKLRMKDRQTDFSYWQTQSYQVRLAALEEIRAEYHRWKYDAEPRLQRVCQITKR